MSVTSSHQPATSSHQPAPDIPYWMATPQQPTPDDPTPQPSPATMANRLTTYANLFETALERIMGGTPLATIVANDPRGIQLGRFLYWITKDPLRRQRYEEACMIAAEAMAHELVTIADANPEDNPATLMEDVQRSIQRIKARQYLMEKWSPQRYGDTRRVQIDQTTVSASITPEDLRKLSLDDLKRLALERFAKAASPDGDVIDVEAA